MDLRGDYIYCKDPTLMCILKLFVVAWLFHTEGH